MNKKKNIYIYRFKRDICLRKETEGKRSRNRICRRNRDSHLNIFRDTFRNIKHIYPGIYGGSKSLPVYSTRQQFSRFIRYTAMTLPLQPCHEQNAVIPEIQAIPWNNISIIRALACAAHANRNLIRSRSKQIPTRSSSFIIIYYLEWISCLLSTCGNLIMKFQ